MSAVQASLLLRVWRRVDIKLSIDGEMHLLRWRRGMFNDEVLFDDRRVATARGLFGREGVFGLDIEAANGARIKLVLMIDAEPDWNSMSGDMRPRGVRLESAEASLIAVGSCEPDRAEPFRQLYDRAVKAFGLS